MPKHRDEISEQAEQDRKDQQAERDAAEKAGNIPQVSSAALHNYPDAEYSKAEPDDSELPPEQPQTGAAATAENQPVHRPSKPQIAQED